MTEEFTVNLGDLRRLELRPGDRFVLTLDHTISHDQLSRLDSYWKNCMGNDTKLLVLEKGMELSVLSSDKTSE